MRGARLAIMGPRAAAKGGRMERHRSVAVLGAVIAITLGTAVAWRIGADPAPAGASAATSPPAAAPASTAVRRAEPPPPAPAPERAIDAAPAVATPTAAP